MKTLLGLFENKTIDVALLTAAGAIAAYFGFNLPIAAIVTFLTPIMAGLGFATWQQVSAAKQETAIKLRLIEGTSFRAALDFADVHSTYLAIMGKASNANVHDAKTAPVAKQAGYIKLALAMCLSLIGCGAALYGCAGATAAGKCEVAAVEQIVVTNGSADVSIVSDIISAAITGGATLGTLLAQLDQTFGPATVACAEELADDVLTTLKNIGVSSSAPTAAPGGIPLDSGIAILHADMDKRHLKHR